MVSGRQRSYVLYQLSQHLLPMLYLHIFHKFPFIKSSISSYPMPLLPRYVPCYQSVTNSSQTSQKGYKNILFTKKLMMAILCVLDCTQRLFYLLSESEPALEWLVYAACWMMVYKVYCSILIKGCCIIIQNKYVLERTLYGMALQEN